MHHTFEKNGRVFAFAEALPNNERVNKMRAEQKFKDEAEYELKMKKIKEEASKQQQEEEILEKMQNIQEMSKNNNDNEISEEQINFQMEYIKKIDNNLNLIIRSLIDNISPYELNFAGIDLDIIYITTIMNILKDRGKSLHTLNLSRKGLGKKHSSIIANMLKENKTLRRLELEGNDFGPDDVKKFAEALKVNKTLIYLDLENNNLTDFFEDTSGIEELFEALRNNHSLISLNLANTYLNPKCWQKIVSCLRVNKTLIHLDISQNQFFQMKDQNQKESGLGDKELKYSCLGLDNEQIKEVKNLLEVNKEEYDKFKKLEWKERKAQKLEDEEMENYNTTISQMKINEAMKKDDKKFIENLYMKNFEDLLNIGEDDFMKNVEDFYAKTKERLTKKPGKKGGKKGAK